MTRNIENLADACYQLALERERLHGAVDPWDTEEALAVSQGMLARALQISLTEARAIMEAIGYRFTGALENAESIAESAIERFMK